MHLSFRQLYQIDFSTGSKCTAVQYLRHIWSYDDPVLIRFIFNFAVFLFFSGKKERQDGSMKKKVSLSFSLYLSICLEAVVFIMNRNMITFSSVYVLRARQKYYHDFISNTQFTVSKFVGQMSLNRYNPIQFHLSSFFLYVWIWWWSPALILECKNQIEKKTTFLFSFFIRETVVPSTLP